MNVTFTKDERTGRDMLQVNDARIVFRNFAGRPDKYNKQGGVRCFNLVIDDPDIAQALADAGWNVTIKAPRDEGELPFMHMKVKIAFNNYGPNIYLVSGPNRCRLTEDNVECLDGISLSNISMDIRPYDWPRDDGTVGRTAYLQNMEAVQELDRFARAAAEVGAGAYIPTAKIG